MTSSQSSKATPNLTPLSPLTKSLRHMARREARFHSHIAEVVFGNWLRYVLFRVRIPMFGQLLFAGIHFAEFAALWHIFSNQGVTRSLIAQNITVLASSFLWGALEVYRTQVRQAQSKGDRQILHNRWITAIAWLGLLVTLPACGYLSWITIALGEAPAPEDLYLLTCAMRFGTDALARTQYSGIFALHRVYRPISVTVALELAGIGLGVMGWYAIGPHGFPLALMGLAGLRLVASWRINQRAYRMFKEPVPKITRRLNVRTVFNDIKQRQFWMAGLSQLSQRTVGLLAMVFLFNKDTRDLGYVIHLTVPVLTAASSWTGVFYFDIRKYTNGTLQPFLAIMLKRLGYFAASLGAFLAIVQCSIMYSVAPQVHVALVGMVALLTVPRSLLSYLQVRFFGEGQYLPLILSSIPVVVIASLEIFQVSYGDLAERAVWMNAATWLGCALALIQIHRRKKKDLQVLRRSGEGILGWVSRMMGSPVTAIYELELDHELSLVGPQQLKRALEKSGGKPCEAIPTSRNTIMMFTCNAKGPDDIKRTAIVESGGALLSMRSLKPKDLRKKLNTLMQSHKQNGEDFNLSDDSGAHTADLAKFEELTMAYFPESLWLQPNKASTRESRRKIARMSMQDKIDAVNQALQSVRQMKVGQRHSQNIAIAFAPFGVCQAMAVIPKPTEPLQMSRLIALKEEMRLVSLQETIKYSA